MPQFEPPDDPTIANNDELWRRVPPQQLITEDDGSPRASSAAFDDEELSVNVAKDTTMDKTLAGHAGFSIVGFPAGLAREHEQRVVRKPLPDNPAHAEVIGRKTGSVKKALYRGSRWVHLSVHK